MHTISTILTTVRADGSSGCHVNYVEAIIGNVVVEVEVNGIFGTGIMLRRRTHSVSWGWAVGFVTVGDGVLIRVSAEVPGGQWEFLPGGVPGRTSVPLCLTALIW